MLRRLTVICAAFFCLAVQARADVVIDWDNVLLAAVRVDKTPPPKASRAMAMVHVAIFDAVDGLLGGYTPYHVTTSPPPHAVSAEAAAAAAAHKVLVAVYPAQKATFDGALATSLAAIPDGPEKSYGVDWGEAVTDRNLVTGPAWTAHVEWLRQFLAVLGTRIAHEATAKA